MPGLTMPPREKPVQLMSLDSGGQDVSGKLEKKLDFLQLEKHNEREEEGGPAMDMKK